jgi:hypothetical protein
MSAKGKESLQSFRRSRFPPLKQRAVGKPRKAARQVSVSDATLGRLERSPSKDRTWHVSNRRTGSTSATFGVYDWERREELLRLQQEEETLKTKWLNPSALEADTEIVGESSQRTPSPIPNDDDSEKMEYMPGGEPDVDCTPGSPMEVVQGETVAIPPSDVPPLDDTTTFTSFTKPTKRKQAAGPSEGQQMEYDAWTLLLPSLLQPYLYFLKVEKEEVSPSMLGVTLLESECDGSCRAKDDTRVLCLFIECMCSLNWCDIR